MGDRTDDAGDTGIRPKTGDPYEDPGEKRTYECADCGKAIFTDRETCPACGSDAVVARTGDDEELTDDESGDDTATGTAERDDAGTDDP